MFFRRFVASKAHTGRSEKTGVVEDRRPKMSTKFAPRMRASAIRKSKLLKTRRLGALLEVELGKICTTPARESDLEVKIVKTWQVRSTFGSWAPQNLHHACARERFGSQNRQKLACSEHFRQMTSSKFAPRLRARAIRKSKSLKTRRLGALLEVELRKICATPARESDLEVKIVKNWWSRDVFWGSKCVSRGRRRDFDTLQNTWQAQDFVRVAKTLAGVGDLKRVWNDAFRVADAMILRFVTSMFETSDAETVERLQTRRLQRLPLEAVLR